MKVYIEIRDLSGNEERTLVSHYFNTDLERGECISLESLLKRQIGTLKSSKVKAPSSGLWCDVYMASGNIVSVYEGSLKDFKSKGLDCLSKVMLDKKGVKRLNSLFKY